MYKLYCALPRFSQALTLGIARISPPIYVTKWESIDEKLLETFGAHETNEKGIEKLLNVILTNPT